MKSTILKKKTLLFSLIAMTPTLLLAVYFYTIEEQITSNHRLPLLFSLNQLFVLLFAFIIVITVLLVYIFRTKRTRNTEFLTFHSQQYSDLNPSVDREMSEQKWASDLRIANKELAFQNDEKEKRAQELVIANLELEYQNEEKENRANELIIANEELAFQNHEKEKRADELMMANKELEYQNKVKEKRAAALVIANKELAFQNEEKEKRAAELVIANQELVFQNKEKEKRAAELVIANEELLFQTGEKQNRANELIIANKELFFQEGEKQNRADELVIADKELDFQNREKEKRAIENKELEAYTNSLKLASQYSLSLIEASRDPLFTISQNGKITDTNKASVRVTGVAKEHLIGSNFIDYFTDSAKAKIGYEAIFSNGFVVDYPLTIKDHKLTDVLFNGAVYNDENGNILGAVAVARDITEQKLIEKELIEAKVFAELATTIAEDAKIIAENATKKAEEAVKSKQQFLSNMSHEIRTPMNAIIGFTKVVLKTELTAKQKEYLMAIKMSGDALIVLINDILDLAKVDAGKMTFEKTPFKLNLSIKAMLHLFETKIQEKNLKLITHYDSNIPEVLIGDPVRLHQIILNLVSNAVKFTHKGTITVTVHLATSTVVTSAVSAIIGTEDFIVCRMYSVASNPFISGICKSIRMISKGFNNNGSSSFSMAIFPLPAISHSKPKSSSKVFISNWLSSMSSTTNILVSLMSVLSSSISGSMTASASVF
jgi:PAS domain S-box-containing protein